MPELEVLKTAVLFNTALVVGSGYGFVTVFCPSWSEDIMGATLLEGCGMENAGKFVDRRTIERMTEADPWLDVFPRVSLLRFRRPWCRINGGKFSESFFSKMEHFNRAW